VIGRDWSIGARLFTAYAISLAVCSTLVAGIVYTGVRFLPSYQFSQVVQIEPGTEVTYAPGTPVTDAAPDGPLVVATTEELWGLVLAVAVVAVIVVLALGLAAGWTVSRRVLAPLQAIAEAAERAASGDLSSRIGARGPRDELRRLADTFDDTMARLERSLDASRRFAANASHELRTPLATTKGLLELLPDAAGAERAEIERMLESTNERGIRLVGELLALARAEHLSPEQRVSVDLAALVDDALDEFEPLAADTDLVLTRRIEPAVVEGERTMLELAVRNLVHNAISYNVAGGGVCVNVRRGGGEGESDHAIVVVENDGPHIAPDIVDRLAEPFYRASERTYEGDHHGLGLAMVASVARAHKGRLQLSTRNEGGLRVALELPSEG
jgi:two-component system sensor histidine kinase VanS